MLSIISYSINGINVVNPQIITPKTDITKFITVFLGFLLLYIKYQIERIRWNVEKKEGIATI